MNSNNEYLKSNDIINENQDAEIKFNKDLANQEWINEKNYLRYMTMCCPSFEFRAHVFNTVSYHKFFFGSISGMNNYI